MRTAVRSFPQFARYRGDLALDLAAFVPAVASWSLSTLPKSLPPEQVEQALALCPRTTAVGRRAYAVLLSLARLGLRAGEVVRLTLEDIEWETSRITIRGKMNRVDQLPLPADVGKAIAAYLKHDRPRALSTRRLFVRVRAPRTGFKCSGLVAYENKTKGDYVIRLKGPYDIALNQQPDGTFGLTADLWNGHVEKEVGQNYGNYSPFHWSPGFLRRHSFVEPFKEAWQIVWVGVWRWFWLLCCSSAASEVFCCSTSTPSNLSITCC